MVMGSSVVSPLGYQTSMLHGLAHGNYLGTREGSLVEVSLGSMASLMIGTVEGYLVGLSLGLPHVSPIEFPNPGADLPVTLLGKPLGLLFGSEAVRFWCCCQCVMDRHEANCARGGEVDISCVLHFGALITSNMNSVRYFQHLELLTLELSTTWLIIYSEGR